MNLRHTLIAAAALAFAAAAQAHECTGGTDGGMDATGNQCNDLTTVVAATPPAPASKQAEATVRAPALASRPAKRTAKGAERLARVTSAQGH